MRSQPALSDLDLILMDTAGRSPQDGLRIQELKAMLNEARADEVHVVLSSVLVLTEPAIPLHIPLTNNINVFASINHFKLTPKNPLVLITIQPKYLSSWNRKWGPENQGNADH